MARLRSSTPRGRRLWVVRTFGLVAVTAAFAIVFVAASGANLTGSSFEGNDGNLVVNTSGNTDWCTDFPAPTGSAVCAHPFPGLVNAQDTPPGNQDNAFANGTKQDDAVPSIGTGGVPNKGDLDRFYLANSLESSKNFLYLGFELVPVSNASASVHQGFEFNQNFCNPNAPQTGSNQCTSNNVTPVRKVGDVLIVFDIEGGGNPVLSYRKWVTSGTCEVSQDSPPCWGPKQTLSPAVAQAALNQASVVDPINPNAPRTIGQFRFGEAAINLTDAGLLTGCAGFGSAYTVSRSSGDSGSATMKDFITPQRININNCGKIIIKKVTIPSPDPTDTSFNFTAGGGLSPTSFSLKNGGEQDYNDLNPGSGYNVAETVPANWVLTSATCSDGSPVTNIDVSAGETVTCTFTNTLQTGAIKVTKMRKHAAAGPGDHPHAGVTFTVNGVSKQTDANGVACFDGLLFATYTVHETVPAGYQLDAPGNDQQVTVNNAATCADSPYGGETVSFHNTPLTDISITVNSQVDGGTASTVTCTPDGPSGTTGANGDGTFSDTNLVPGTYTCTVAIDP